MQFSLITFNSWHSSVQCRKRENAFNEKIRLNSKEIYKGRRIELNTYSPFAQFQFRDVESGLIEKQGVGV